MIKMKWASTLIAGVLVFVFWGAPVLANSLDELQSLYLNIGNGVTVRSAAIGATNKHICVAYGLEGDPDLYYRIFDKDGGPISGQTTLYTSSPETESRLVRDFGVYADDCPRCDFTHKNTKAIVTLNEGEFQVLFCNVKGYYSTEDALLYARVDTNGIITESPTILQQGPGWYWGSQNVDGRISTIINHYEDPIPPCARYHKWDEQVTFNPGSTTLFDYGGDYTETRVDCMATGLGGARAALVSFKEFCIGDTISKWIDVEHPAYGANKASMQELSNYIFADGNTNLIAYDQGGVFKFSTYSGELMGEVNPSPLFTSSIHCSDWETYEGKNISEFFHGTLLVYSYTGCPDGGPGEYVRHYNSHGSLLGISEHIGGREVMACTMSDDGIFYLYRCAEIYSSYITLHRIQLFPKYFIECYDPGTGEDLFVRWTGLPDPSIAGFQLALSSIGDPDNDPNLVISQLIYPDENGEYETLVGDLQPYEGYRVGGLVGE